MWEWHGPAVDVGDAAAKWFSAHLGKPVRLVRYGGKPTAVCAGLVIALADIAETRHLRA